MIKRGFTLIELLVVVLIIGILAVIALPQYQVAVAKARIAAMIPVLDGVIKGQTMYYLTEGKYAHFQTYYGDAVPLDIDLSLDRKEIHLKCLALAESELSEEQREREENYKNGFCQLMRLKAPKLGLEYTLPAMSAQGLSGTGANYARFCLAPIDDEVSNKACQSYTGTTTSVYDSSGHHYYRFNYQE